MLSLDVRRLLVLAVVSLCGCIPPRPTQEISPTALRGATVRVLRAGATQPFVGVVEVATADSLVVRTNGQLVTLASRDIDRLQMPETDGQRARRAGIYATTMAASTLVLLPFAWTEITLPVLVPVALAGPILSQSLLPTRFVDAMLPSRTFPRDGFLLVTRDGYPEPVGGQRVRVTLGGGAGESAVIGSLSMRGRDSLDVYDPDAGVRIPLARAEVVEIAVSRGRLAATLQDATMSAGSTIGIVMLAGLVSNADRPERFQWTLAAALAAGSITFWTVTRERWAPAQFSAPP